MISPRQSAHRTLPAMQDQSDDAKSHVQPVKPQVHRERWTESERQRQQASRFHTSYIMQLTVIVAQNTSDSTRAGLDALIRAMAAQRALLPFEDQVEIVVVNVPPPQTAEEWNSRCITAHLKKRRSHPALPGVPIFKLGLEPRSASGSALASFPLSRGCTLAKSGISHTDAFDNPAAMETRLLNIAASDRVARGRFLYFTTLSEMYDSDNPPLRFDLLGLRNTLTRTKPGRWSRIKVVGSKALYPDNTVRSAGITAAMKGRLAFL